MTNTVETGWAADWRSTPIPMSPKETGPQRCHRAPVGIGARTFREGFARGGRDALRRIWHLLPAEHRSLVTVLANDYAAEDADD